MIPYKQLSLADIFTDCQNKFDNDKYEFLELLENTINLDEIVPASLTDGGSRLRSGFLRYLRDEIAIEYKSCLYFFAILFFYCVCLVCRGIYSADMLHMAEHETPYL